MRHRPFRILISVLAIIVSASHTAASAQTFDEHMNRGNQEFYGGDFSDAASCYEKALKLNPGNLQAQFGLASALLEENRLPQALAAAQRLNSTHPDFAPGWFVTGKIHDRQGNREQARQAFATYVQKAGDRIPPDPQLRLKLREYGVY